MNKKILYITFSIFFFLLIHILISNSFNDHKKYIKSAMKEFEKYGESHYKLLNELEKNYIVMEDFIKNIDIIDKKLNKLNSLR